MGRFFWFLWRLVLLLIFLGLLSVLLYLAVPWLYQTFIRPLEQNTAQVRELQSRQQQTTQELEDLQTRLETLEGVQNEHDGTLTDLDERMQEFHYPFRVCNDVRTVVAVVLGEREGVHA